MGGIRRAGDPSTGRRARALPAIAAIAALALLAATPAHAVRITTEVFLGDLNDVFFGAGEELVFVIDPVAATITVDQAASNLTALGQPIDIGLTASIDFSSGFYDGTGFIGAPQIALVTATDHADGDVVEAIAPPIPIDPWDGLGVGVPISMLQSNDCADESGLWLGPRADEAPRHFVECGVSLFLTAFVVSEEFSDIDCALAPDGARCEDGDACTGADTCAAGVCVAGAPIDCDDGEPCSVDSCEPGQGCVHVGTDTDADLVCDDVDNCPRIANAAQVDVGPTDGIGDACECRLAAPGECLLDGKGSDEADCLTELIFHPLAPISNAGLPDRKIRCTDGDACDLDGAADGSCSFRIAVCLNNRDPRAPACTSAGIDVVNLRRPSVGSKRAHEAAAAAGLLASISVIAPSALDGDDDVRFTPAMTAPDSCGPLVDVAVPINGKRGRLKLSLRTSGDGASRLRDRDGVKVFCRL